MDWNQMPRAAIVALLAVVTITGFVAPVAAIDAGDAMDADEDGVEDTTTTADANTSDDGQYEAPTDDATTVIDTLTGTEAATQSDDPFPEEVCTDLTGLVHEEFPYDQVIWVDDLPQDAQDSMQPSAMPGYEELPEDAQPPGVPWTILTPRAIGSIGFGAAPNQCDVVDPNDPPYDPTEDDLDPDADGDVVEETEAGTTLLIVNGTLNRSGEGPGGEATVEFDAAEDGEANPEIRLNDGEKDYAVDPGLRYWDDGTIVAENDVTVIGMTAGGEVDCIGEECELDVRGAPGLVDYPSVPSHSTEDPRDDADQATSGETSGTTGAGSPADVTVGDDSDSDDTAGDGRSDGSTGDPSTDADPSGDGADTSDGSDGSSTTDETTPTEDGSDVSSVAQQDPPAGPAIPSDSRIPALPGLGAMSLLGTTLIGSRLR